jgi:hypothetical protein
VPMTVKLGSSFSISSAGGRSACVDWKEGEGSRYPTLRKDAKDGAPSDWWREKIQSRSRFSSSWVGRMPGGRPMTTPVKVGFRNMRESISIESQNRKATPDD